MTLAQDGTVRDNNTGDISRIEKDAVKLQIEQLSEVQNASTYGSSLGDVAVEDERIGVSSLLGVML